MKKGTPPEVLDCLRSTFNEAAQDPSIANEQFKKIGFRYEFLDAAAFAKASDNQAAIADKYKTQILGE